MKKLFKVILVLYLGLALAIGAAILFLGRREADSLSASKPLQQLVEQTISRPGYVPYAQIAPFLLEATVCVEDARFYEHGAVDIIGLTRAALSQLIPGMEKSGGSTISQQVVKNLYQQFHGGLEWKAAEFRLADQLEKILTKNEILALYVNIINYGDSNIGIAQAAKNYFNYTPADLTDAEASLLAGIPQNPANFQLSNHAANAKRKQAVVLDAMVRNNRITQRQADLIYLEPIDYLAHGTWNQLLAWTPLQKPDSFQLVAFNSQAGLVWAGWHLSF